MKVRLIKKQTIEDFITLNARSRPSFEDWLNTLAGADWEQPSDMMHTFGYTDLLGNGSNRVVFNIGGNNYRLICGYKFGPYMVHLFVKWIGTHAEYDKLCAKNFQYTVSRY